MGFLLMSTAPLGHSHAVAPLCFILLFPATVILHLRLLFLFFCFFYYRCVKKLKAACDNSGESLVSFNPAEDKDGGVQGRSSSSKMETESWDPKPDLIPVAALLAFHSASQTAFLIFTIFLFVVQILECLVGSESNETQR